MLEPALPVACNVAESLHCLRGEQVCGWSAASRRAGLRRHRRVVLEWLQRVAQASRRSLHAKARLPTDRRAEHLLREAIGLPDAGARRPPRRGSAGGPAVAQHVEAPAHAITA